MILIAAVGRSATTYTSEILNEIGLEVKHEGLGKDGSVGWKHSIGNVTKFKTIIHQVRHPLSVIKSIISTSAGAETNLSVVRKHIFLPKNGDVSVVEMSMYLWINFNRAIEENASWRFRIEDIDKEFPELCRRLGLKGVALPDISKKTNTRDTKKGYLKELTIDDLYKENEELAKELVKMAVKYGYSI